MLINKSSDPIETVDAFLSSPVTNSKWEKDEGGKLEDLIFRYEVYRLVYH